jgi:phosphate transport system substrate-binding protein
MKLVYSVFSSNKLKILLLCLFATVNTVWAHEHLHKPSGAPSFTDPDVLSKVSKGWNNKPITYNKLHADADLVVALGQQSYPLFHELIQKYAKKNNLKIVVKAGTCGITSGRLRKKSADIGAFCCPPSQSDRYPGLKFHSLGISPIALIVHPDNPLTNVSTAQAREIFQGGTKRWSELKATETSQFKHLIKPIARLHCKIRPGHWRGLLKNEDQFSPRLFEVGVISDMLSQVSRNTGAIGWEVPIMISYYRDKGLVRMLKIDGHAPTDLQYILTGKYPFYRSFSLTTWSPTKNKKSNEKSKLALKLVRYLQKHIETIHKDISYVTPSQLRKAGWRFKGDELIGEPIEAKKQAHK